MSSLSHLPRSVLKGGLRTRNDRNVLRGTVTLGALQPGIDHHRTGGSSGPGHLPHGLALKLSLPGKGVCIYATFRDTTPHNDFCSHQMAQTTKISLGKTQKDPESICSFEPNEAYGRFLSLSLCPNAVPNTNSYSCKYYKTSFRFLASFFSICFT